MTKEELEKSLDFVNEERERMQQELEKKNNNWNELKKYVDKLYEDDTYHSIGEVLDKIEELENEKF